MPAARAHLTPLSLLRVSSHQIPAHPTTKAPNTSLTHHPLLHYHSAFLAPTASSPAAIEAHLAAIGAVVPQWRYTMYSRAHFHSTAHEVLAPTAGAAVCRFGGGDGDDSGASRNPGAVDLTLRTGDVVVVPAGVAHALVREVGDVPFQMVGAYPPGPAGWDMCYGGEEGVEERVRALDWFRHDPVYGDEGPALRG